jgi:hypothetical protein
MQNQIHDVAGANFFGQFTFSTIKGVNHKKIQTYSKAEWDALEARIHKLKHDDIVSFWCEFGGEEVDRDLSRNRLVDQGIGLLVAGLATGTTTMATKIQLGRGSTGTWTRSLSGVRVPIIDGGGLDEAVATISVQSSGEAGSETDILRATKSFTSSSATLYNDAFEGPDEAAIRTTTGSKCICYTYFTEKLLGSGDILAVTYNLKLVP